MAHLSARYAAPDDVQISAAGQAEGPAMAQPSWYLDADQQFLKIMRVETQLERTILVELMEMECQAGLCCLQGQNCVHCSIESDAMAVEDARCSKHGSSLQLKGCWCQTRQDAHCQ